VAPADFAASAPAPAPAQAPAQDRPLGQMMVSLRHFVVDPVDPRRGSVGHRRRRTRKRHRHPRRIPIPPRGLRPWRNKPFDSACAPLTPRSGQAPSTRLALRSRLAQDRPLRLGLRSAHASWALRFRGSVPEPKHAAPSFIPLPPCLCQ